MQYALRPYATAGVALVGASIIAVTPLAVRLPEVQMRPVQLVDAWSDLFTDTTANLENIAGGADLSAISGVFSELFTNPLGVISALTSLDPTVTTTAGPPLTVDVQLPPGLELAIAQLAAEGATLGAINDVVGQLSSDPSNALSTLFEAPATIANAFLNGADNVSLLDGIIDIPAFNGILAPEQSLTVDLNLTDLINALGLGGLNLSNFDLTALLDQVGLGNLDLGDLVNDLGLSTDTLGTLLGNPTLSTFLTDFGLGNLDLGQLSLTSILSDLGLDGSVLSGLSLTKILEAFQIDPTIDLSLPALLTDLGLGASGNGFLDTGLGTLVGDLPPALLTPVLGSLNGVLDTLLSPLTSVPGVDTALGLLGINLDDLLTPASLETALNNVTIGDLLGGQSIDLSVSNLLADLDVSVPNDLTIGGILGDLGFTSETSDLNLGELLGALDLGNDPVGSVLDLQLGSLLTDLGIAGDPLNLADLGNLTNLDLSSLLGDLGLGDLATINVDSFGGLITELVDTVPQQILAAF
jgi:hypothetical protein